MEEGEEEEEDMDFDLQLPVQMEQGMDYYRPIRDTVTGMKAKAERFLHPSVLRQLWLHYWGKPISLADLLCCPSPRMSPCIDRHSENPCRCAIAGPELKPFLPALRDLPHNPIFGPSQNWVLGPRLVEAAKTRRRTCFDGYSNTQHRRQGIQGNGWNLAPPAQFGQIPPDAVSLPHGLLLFSMVLPHLPLPDVFRARAVCRLWHQTLSSPLHLCRVMQNPDFDCPRLVIQTSSSNHSSCLAIFDRDHWFSNPIPLPNFCLRAAAAGLFCFSFETGSGCWEEGVHLLVGNPITQRWRRLPPGPQVSRLKGENFCSTIACTMWADHAQGCYKVFVASSYLWMYDSSSDGWTLMDFFEVTDGLCRQECSVTPSGLLHYLTKDAKHVALYDMERGSVSKVETSGPSNMDQRQQPFSRLPALVYCNDTMFVVARMKADVTMSGRFPWVIHGLVAIWELDAPGFDDSDKWGWPVSVVPQNLLEDAIAGSDGTDFCVTTDGDQTIYLVLPGGATMLVYNVASKMWSSLPGCPSAFTIGFHPQPYYVPLLWLRPI
ncbi:hypothetical protein GOP47_0027854 [Adiantum capillus-veneris]|nr:hypothetical protein GOP47_0027854 [Adiantum capillus-veneris]